MTATQYKGPRLCSCGHRAEVCVNTGRADASHITLLCWSCADAMVGLLSELNMLCAEAEKAEKAENSGVSAGGFKQCAS